MGCNCGKPKCNGKCGISPAVLQINNPDECTLFHKVTVPASMGDSKTNPPKNGDYKNVLLYFEADETSWLFSSDGIPTQLVNGMTKYADLTNDLNTVTKIYNTLEGYSLATGVPITIICATNVISSLSNNDSSTSGYGTIRKAATNIYDYTVYVPYTGKTYQGRINSGSLTSLWKIDATAISLS